VEPAVPDDEEWIKPLLRSHEQLYGGDVSWRRFWRAVRNGHPRAVAEFWDVVRPFGFVHWRLRKDGTRAVDELVVAGVARDMGIGSKLLAAVGQPAEVHAMAGDQRAGAFLRARGFQPQATIAALNGRARHTIWWSG
jgi:GNAT superfamily N-acetyltransferase